MELETLIARCPRTPDRSQWTIAEKRALMHTYSHWMHRTDPDLLEPLFEWKTGRYIIGNSAIDIFKWSINR